MTSVISIVHKAHVVKDNQEAIATSRTLELIGCATHRGGTQKVLENQNNQSLATKVVPNTV